MKTPNKSKKAAALQSLKWIKDNSVTAKNGSVNIAFGIGYFTAKEILTRYTRDQGAIPERTHRRAVNLAIHSWLNNKKYRENSDMLSAFLKALEMESSQLEKDKRVFNVLMFLNVDESIRNLEPISIQEDKLSVKTWDELSSLAVDNLWKEIQLMDHSNAIFALIHSKLMPRSSDFLPILMSIKSYGPEAAVAIANDRFDLLRAILNMSVLRGHMTFWSAPKQLSVFLPTPVLGVFDLNGNLVAPYRTIEKYDHEDYRKSTLKESELPTAKFFLSFFDHALEYPNSERHIFGLMRLYQAAIDINATSSAFLGMWQVLESAVTFGEETIPQRDVVSRISALVSMDSMLHCGLDLFAEMRNELVHNGEFAEEGKDLLSTLKLIAETCVIALLRLSKELHTVSELRDYIRYLTLGDDDLARKMDVIALIKKHRTKTSGSKL